MKEISRPARERLITLSKLLKQLNEERVTSRKIAALTGWTEDTVRRDISLLELHSGKKNGYAKNELEEAVCRALNLAPEKEKRNICIVGLGSLGLGLLESSCFENSTFKLTAAFETNQNRLDLIKSHIPLFPTLDLETKIRQLKIEYALLAVADQNAQFMADRLIKYGIKGIINYTNMILQVPPEVKISNCSPEFMLTTLL